MGRPNLENSIVNGGRNRPMKSLFPFKGKQRWVVDERCGKKAVWEGEEGPQGEWQKELGT